VETRCIGEDSLIDFVGRRLAPDRAELVERHLAECESCRELVSATVRDELITGCKPDLALAATVTPTTEREPTPAPRERGPTLPRGTTIGRYVVLSLLGRGGMGIVYRAYDPDLNRQVAIKVVGLRDLSDDAREPARQRMMREAQALAKLSHPNVVAVYDVGNVGDDVFIAMEFVEGMTLRDWLAERRRSKREILSTFRAAGKGLAAAHQVGVVHRDFKPDNVMVGADGRVRVLDFGLARFGESAPRTSRRSLPAIATGSSEITQAGTVLGTPAYMSPEQDAGLEAEPASDQFSFCVALYEALYGGLPHRGDSYPELVASRADGEVVSPPTRSGVSSRVRRAVLVGLRSAPEQRYPNLDALLDDLRPRALTSPRAIAIAVVTTLVIGASASWAVARSTVADVGPHCEFVAADVTKVWNPARRARLAVAFAGSPHGAEATAQVAGAIDRWTGDWVTARTKLCELSQQSNGLDEPKFADQLQCLQRRLAELEGVMLAFTALDQSSVEHAPETLSKMRPVDECAGVASDTPSDAVKEAAMPIVRTVIEARLAHNAGKLDEALAKAKQALAQAKEAHSPAIAIAWQALGETQSARGELDDARDSLRKAAIASAEIHEDGMIADAWIALVQVSFVDRKLDDNLRNALFAAELAATRLRDDDARKPLFHYTSGTVHIMEGKFADAKVELETAAHEYDRLNQQSNFPSVFAVENSLGMVYTELGDWPTAKFHLERAERMLRKLYGDNPVLGRVLNNQAFLAQYQEHYADAEKLMLQSLVLLGKLGDSNSLVGEQEFNLGELYAMWGKCDRAKPHIARARDILTRARGADSPMLAMVTLDEERCRLNTDPRGAITRLNRARDIAAAHPVTIRELPELDFVIAQAIDRAGNHSRAMDLAADARRAYVAISPGTAERVHAIDRWLAGK
jgi:tetratricopeptide (TPR) repeat protein/predicted Ser/Thr protein kinase